MDHRTWLLLRLSCVESILLGAQWHGGFLNWVLYTEIILFNRIFHEINYKPSSYWGTPISIYGNPRRFRVNIGFWGHLYSDGNRRAKEGVTPLCFNANKHQNKPVTWESNSCCPCHKNLSMTCK